MTDFLQMIYREKALPLIGSLLLLTCVSSAQITLTASANENRIAENEFVQVQFRIENARQVRSIDPPSFDDFEIVSGPNHESGSITINGNRKFYAAVSFVLKPLKAGKFRLGPASAFADGQTVKSNSLTISVSGKAGGSSGASGKAAPAPLPRMGHYDRASGMRPNDSYVLRAGENPTEKIKKNLFVRLEANKTSSYVGEPVVVSFKLYTRLLSRTTITDAPSFNGFSVTEMDVNENASEEVINGKTYNTYTLRKVQLFPMRDGSYTISPLRAANKVQFIKLDPQGRSDISDDPFAGMLQDFGIQSLSSGGMVEEQIALSSNSLTINVKKLPEKNQPEGYKGAVGKFAMHCTMDREDMTTDDAGNLAVTITGSGNLAFINVPDIKWPDGVDAYDARVKEQIDQEQVPVQGVKTFHIPFTASKPGTYSLPPIKLSWFNPATGVYDSTKTEPIAFRIAAGSHLAAVGPESIEKAKGLLSVSGLEWAAGIALVSGLTILMLFVLFRKRHKEKELESQVRLSDLRARQEADEFVIPGNPLEPAHEKLASGNAEEFYRTLETCLKRYLARKLNIPHHQLSADKVLEEMDKCNVGIGTTRLFESLVREIELGLYAKSSHSGQTRYLYEKSAELIALLDKQICA